MLTDTILRNRYKILRELGRGGFSVTYLAVDMDLPGNPKCVVKQLKTRHSNNTILQIAKKLFNREAQVLYRLGKGHKQIPEMFAHFEENDEFYLVQEFVDGYDLTREIKSRHRLSEDKVIKLLQEVLEVLSFVHENNVIHRDIKLRNIMRRREDGKIVLIDFGAVKEIKGLAKNEQGDVNSTLIIGTPGYMPDEQANGKPRLCSDIYAVGMLGIQALTGISPRELPFNPNNGELIWRNCAKVSDRFAEVLTGMVRHHFSQRYQTAAEALAALKSPVIVKPNTSSAYEAPPVTLPSNIRQSRPVAVPTLVGLAGLMGVGFGLGVFGWNFFQSSTNGNEPVQTTEIPANINKINPSVKPEGIRLSPPPTFSPSASRKDSSANYPVLKPFPFPSFFINKTSATKESSQSKEKNNKAKQSVLEYKPKPVPGKTQPAPKTSIVKERKSNPPTFVTPELENQQQSLPSTAIPVSEEKKEDKKVNESPTSVIPTPQKKQAPSSESPKLQNEENLEPTSKPNTTDSAVPLQDRQESNLEPETSEPETPNSTAEEIENPTILERTDKHNEEEPQAEQPVQTPPSPPNTPAIETDSPSPEPTPSPVETSGTSVVVPTAKPLLENKNFFYTVPTSPNPIPEDERNPTLSPQPTTTPKAETQPTVTPQPTETPQTEAQSTVTPQPTETPQTEAQSTVTPQPTETPQTQETPQASTTSESEFQPAPQVELPTIPEIYASPSPKIELEIIPPQISASPLPQTQKTVNPSPTPVKEQGLSLKRFAI